MLKDNIITLDNNVSYYILQDMNYNGRKYVLAAQADLEKDNLDTNELIVKEIVSEGDGLITADIKDQEEAERITKVLITKFQMEK